VNAEKLSDTQTASGSLRTAVFRDELQEVPDGVVDLDGRAAAAPLDDDLCGVDQLLDQPDQLVPVQGNLPPSRPW
jgi:hypothetical protein